MPKYKQVESTTLTACQSPEAAEAIRLLNEFASLRCEPVTASLKSFLREVLPARIADMRRQVKAKPAGEAA